MSGYADDYKDRQQAAFVAKWAPPGSYEAVAISQESLRWHIARARAAEDELGNLKRVLGDLKRVLS
jgi:hypothetical protein